MGRSAEAIARRAAKRNRSAGEQLEADREDERNKVRRILARGREKRIDKAADTDAGGGAGDKFIHDPWQATSRHRSPGPVAQRPK